MKKWINKHLLLSWGLASIFFAILIHILFSIPAPCKWIEAKWQAGDILTYVSTVALGLLAVWQNQKYEKENAELQNRMLQVEENTFINDNACFALVEDISIKGSKQTACNLETHTEQIVMTFNETPTFSNSSSLELSVKLKMINDNIPSLIRVKDFTFISGDEDGIISFNSGFVFDDEFSRLALYNGYVGFSITVFFLAKEKKTIVENMRKQNNSLIIEFVIELLTHKNIATTIKCRAKLIGSDYNEKEDTYGNYEIYPDEVPQCFWYGIERLDNIAVKKIQ